MFSKNMTHILICSCYTSLIPEKLEERADMNLETFYKNKNIIYISDDCDEDVYIDKNIPEDEINRFRELIINNNLCGVTVFKMSEETNSFDEIFQQINKYVSCLEHINFCAFCNISNCVGMECDGQYIIVKLDTEAC